MSYDIWFEHPDIPNALDRNYTSNCSPMWAKAIGVNLTLGELIETHPQAAELATYLEPALKEMATNPTEYETLNPANGWGDYDSALEYLWWILRNCWRYPNATVKVLR